MRFLSGGVTFFSFNHLDDLAQIFLREFVFVGKERDHLFVGVGEIALDNPRQEPPFVFVLTDSGRVEVGIANFLARQIPFSFQILDYRGDCGVGWTRIRQSFQKVFDNASPLLPNGEHHLFFLMCQLFHGSLLVVTIVSQIYEFFVDKQAFS